MKRIIGLALLASPIIAAGPALAQLFTSPNDSLADGFQNPPNSARPRVWWHWMNGNVSVEGIEKDLDWMSRVGIGGLQNFDASLGTPQIVEKRLVYMDPAWKAAFKRAVQIADQKGLEFAIAASPGWSETGGPWVKPEEGMKKLVWSEMLIKGGKRFSGKLPAVPGTTGPYQSIKAFDFISGLAGDNTPKQPSAAGEVAVFAVSAKPDLPAPSAAGFDGSAVNVTALLDNDLESAITISALDGEAPGGFTLRFAQPVTTQSFRFLIPHAKPPFYGPTFKPELQAEIEGKWRKLADIPLGEATTTVSFVQTTARAFRVILNKNSGNIPSGLGGQAPGAIELDIFKRPFPKTVQIAEARLMPDARVNLSETKAGYDIVNNFYDIADTKATPGIAHGQVINLTRQMKSDGTLDWKPPKGTHWRIYRFGWSLTGKTNHPATAEATGLEVDKYDAAAVRRYLQHYLGLYRDTVGDNLIGKRGIRALLTDSIEVGNSNWTPRMAEEFKARCGYDLLPWLPALAGEVVGSRAETERFLFDYRATLGELLADAHYGTVAQVAHENGMFVYGEALENGRPVLGDDLAMRKYADVPMAALWTWNRGEQPRASLLGDMKGAASVAHVYGQNLVAAESMTAANSPWDFAPKDLKRIIDLEFAMGVNRPVIHTSVHQPSDDKKPGLSLMIFGQYFNRHESWAEMAKPWVDYMARTGYMLQQGRNFADIAYFYGEEAPVTGLFEFEVPKGLPKNHAYDFVNGEMLRDALRVEGNEIVSTGGARYKAIVLGERSQMMTLATLQRLATMVEAGATVIGTKPEASPSLRDDPAAFKALADRLWSHQRVISTNDSDSGMAKAGITSDFHFEAEEGKADILFVHRRLPNGDIYWINNRNNREETVEARFRVTGKVPELWDAITGETTALPYVVQGNETVIPLPLAPEDAKFIVFRKAITPSTNSGFVGNSLERTVPFNPSWTITFEAGRGAPAGITMSNLAPLNENANPRIKYFSGISTYRTRFSLPKSIKPGAPLTLDLGEVGDLAEVFINGQSAGVVWFAPFSVNIGQHVKTGTNSLEIRVANKWSNRLIGDVQPGAQKVGFVVAPTYQPTAPLRPAGLIGPVMLRY